MLIYIKLLLTALFWGGTWIAGRAIARDVQPFSAALVRFVIASALLLLLTWRVEGRLPSIKRGQIVPVILLGLTGIFAYNFFFFRGLTMITAGRASIIVATNPIMVTLLSALFFREKLNPIKVVGIFLSVSGAAVVISKGNLVEIFGGSLGWGDLYIFGCALSWVAYSLIGKSVLRYLSPLASVAYSSVVGAAALLVPAYFEGVTHNVADYSGTSWLGIVYLALFGTVLGFRWFYEGIQRIGPAKASIFINFVPISAVLLAFFILAEPLSLSLLSGAVLVSVGVYLANTGSLGSVGWPGKLWQSVSSPFRRTSDEYR